MSDEVAIDAAPVQADTAVSTEAPASPAQQTTEAPTTEAPITRENISTPDDAFTLPDEYKEASWAEKIKSQDDLYKQIDNLSGLVGKKTIEPINYETATPEEIAAYHSSLAPENASDYNFGEDGNEAFNNALAPVFQELGFTKYQVESLIPKVNEIAAELASAQHDMDTSADGYLDIMKESFGDNYETVVGGVNKLLKEHLSQDDLAAVDGMNNNTKATIDRTVHKIAAFYEDKIAEIKQEYGVTESGAQADAAQSSPVQDVGKYRSDLRQQLQNIDARSHTAEEKQILLDKLNATYK